MSESKAKKIEQYFKPTKPTPTPAPKAKEEEDELSYEEKVSAGIRARKEGISLEEATKKTRANRQPKQEGGMWDSFKKAMSR